MGQKKTTERLQEKMKQTDYEGKNTVRITNLNLQLNILNINIRPLPDAEESQ